MVDFIEQATLRVRDQSTKQINNINGSIVKLLKNAAKLNNLKIGLDTRGAQGKLSSLNKQLANAAKPRTTTVTVQVNGAQAARNALKGLSGTKTLTVNTRLGSHAPGNFMPPPQRRGLGVRSGIGTGFGGFGFGVSGDDLGFAKLAIAAGAASKALHTLATAGTARARSEQQIVATTTNAQAREITQLRSPSAQLADVDFQKIAAGFLADTSGNVAAAAALAARQEQSAQDLSRIRGITIEEARLQTDGLVKAVGKLTTEMVDANGQLTTRTRETFDTLDKVLAVQPTANAQLISTTVSGLGPSRTAIDQRTLFETAFLSGDFGQRIGNQIQQAINSATGNQKAKANAEFERLGIDQADPRIIADFATWFQEVLRPKVEQDARANLAERGIKAPDEQQLQAAAIQVFQGLFGRQTAQSAGAELFGGQGALARARLQAEAQFAEAAKERAEFAMSWTQQFNAAGVQLTDIMGKLGNTMGNTLAPAIATVAEGLGAVNSFITGEDGKTDPAKAGAVAAGGVAAAGAGLFAGKKLLDVLNPLNGSALALNGSAAALDGAAAALTRAAVAQGAADVMPDGPARRGGRNSIATLGVLGMAAAGAVDFFQQVSGKDKTANEQGLSLLPDIADATKALLNAGKSLVDGFQQSKPKTDTQDALRLTQELNELKTQQQEAAQAFGPGSAQAQDIGLQIETVQQALDRLAPAALAAVDTLARLEQVQARKDADMVGAAEITKPVLNEGMFTTIDQLNSNLDVVPAELTSSMMQGVAGIAAAHAQGAAGFHSAIMSAVSALQGITFNLTGPAGVAPASPVNTGSTGTPQG